MKKIKIIILGGVDNGIRLWVFNEGDVGKMGGLFGDLYVFLFVKNYLDF